MHEIRRVTLNSSFSFFFHLQDHLMVHLVHEADRVRVQFAFRAIPPARGLDDAVVEPPEEGSDAAAPPLFEASNASNASTADDEDDDEPEALCCPIMKVMMRDPVFLAGSGNTYERYAIEEFWRCCPPRGRKRDPLTNADVANASLFTNWDKRREVQAWLSRNEGKVPAGWASRDDVRPPAKEVTDDASKAEGAIPPAGSLATPRVSCPLCERVVGRQYFPRHWRNAICLRQSALPSPEKFTRDFAGLAIAAA